MGTASRNESCGTVIFTKGNGVLRRFAQNRVSYSILSCADQPLVREMKRKQINNKFANRCNGNSDIYYLVKSGKKDTSISQAESLNSEFLEESPNRTMT